MMGALAQTQSAPTPSLLAMLAPVQGGDAGEAGVFDQLVAQQHGGSAPLAAPVAAATPVLPNAPVSALPPATAIETPAVPMPTPAAAPQIALASPDAATAEDAPVPAKPEVAAPDKAIVAANELLATLAQFAAPAAKPAPAKPAVAAPATEGEAAKGDESDVAADAAPVVALPIFAAAPAEPRPAGKPAAETAPQRRDDAPALPMAAPKPRDAAIALPVLAAADAPAAKPAAEPSMTVLFAQPAAQVGGIAEAAKPVVIAERVLDLTSDDAWIEQLASDIAATKSASNEVSFRLMPRHLGRLDVSMMMGDEGVSLKLDTQHEATATIVTAAQVRLVDDLRQQGVRVADTQVTHNPTDAGRQSQQGQGRSPAQDAAHLIETAAERADARDTHDQERAGDRRGRFA